MESGTSSFWISLQGFLEVSSWNLRPKMNDSSQESFFLLSTINSVEFAWFVSKVNDVCFQSSYPLCNVNKSVGWCLLGLQNLPMSWFLDWSKMFNLPTSLEHTNPSNHSPCPKVCQKWAWRVLDEFFEQGDEVRFGASKKSWYKRSLWISIK